MKRSQRVSANVFLIYLLFFGSVFRSLFMSPCGLSSMSDLCKLLSDRADLVDEQCTELEWHDLNITNFMTYVLCSYHHEIKPSTRSTSFSMLVVSLSCLTSCFANGHQFEQKCIL